MKALENPEIYTRINSRIKKTHGQGIKVLAKKKNITEGEALRSILDYYFENNKK